MILVTGGCGYIGSHTVVELYNAGEKEIVIVDDLRNASIDVLDRIKQIIPEVTLHSIRWISTTRRDLKRSFPPTVFRPWCILQV